MPAAAWSQARHSQDLILVMPLASRPRPGADPEPHYQGGHDLASEFCPCQPRLERSTGWGAALLVHNDLEATTNQRSP